MRRFFSVALLWLALAGIAHAQSVPGQIAPGGLLGNPSTAAGAAPPQVIPAFGLPLFPDQFGTVDRTGATDMGAIINSTIAAASKCATKGASTVILSAGVYLITTAIIPKSCVSIVGDGRGQTILLTNNAAPFAQVSGSQLVHFSLSGVTFKDSGSNPGATAMTFTAIQGSTLRNIGFHGYTTGTAMNISPNGAPVTVFDDNTGVWNSSNSFFNLFEDWVQDDTMKIGLIIAGSLATPCNVATATNVVTLNTFKDVQFWGITAVGWDLVRGADTNQFIGNNIIRLIGTGGAVNTPHASFNNIAVQLGDDNATCAGNNDIALERMQLTTTLAAPATSFIMFNAGNNTFGHLIDYQTDTSPTVNSGFTAMAGVTGLCYSINGRNYTTTLNDGAGNLFQLELDQCRYRALMDGTGLLPAQSFAGELSNGIYRPGAGVLGFTKGISTGVNGTTGGSVRLNGATSGSCPLTVAATLGTLNLCGVATIDTGGNASLNSVTAGTIITGTTTLTGTTGTVSATTTIVNPSGGFTITLPSAAASNGRILLLKLIASQTVTSASSNVVPLAGGAAGTAVFSAATAGKFVQLYSDGTAWQIIAAN